ncbi:MAG: DMT family transporter [Clostridia bacterium]|nr:DMT family transporter [Clostridia bacterium]
MKRNNIKGSLILTLGSLIWGFAFVVQSDAANFIKPFAFNSLRSLLGALVIGTYVFIKAKATKTEVFEKTKEYKKNAIIGGIICGIFLAFSVNFQQLGLSVYPEGVPAEARAGFLTALYVVMVPIASIVLRKRVSPVILVAVFIATAGVYLLCLSDGFSGFYLGDGLMLLCALSCTIHIMFVDKYGPIIGGPQLSMIQFVICGIISGVISLIAEPDMTVHNITSALPQILYMGIFSSGVAYTLQIVGQKYAEPAVASISMSLEGVFATLGGWIVLGSALTIREFFGCLLVFVAILTAQIPEILINKKGRSMRND